MRILHYLPRIHLSEGGVVRAVLDICALLAGEGHDVTLATNGREAVEAAEAEDFDLVLMDIQMPEMGGVEATEVIRKRELMDSVWPGTFVEEAVLTQNIYTLRKVLEDRINVVAVHIHH